MNSYTVDGKNYNVADEHVSQFMEKFPSAVKSTKPNNPNEVKTYFNRENDEWKQYRVRT